MSQEQVEEIVDKVISSSDNREFGLVMKLAMEQLKGKADGSLVSQIVRQKLQG